MSCDIQEVRLNDEMFFLVLNCLKSMTHEEAVMVKSARHTVHKTMQKSHTVTRMPQFKERKYRLPKTYVRIKQCNF